MAESRGPDPQPGFNRSANFPSWCESHSLYSPLAEGRGPDPQPVLAGRAVFEAAPIPNWFTFHQTNPSNLNGFGYKYSFLSP